MNTNTKKEVFTAKFKGEDEILTNISSNIELSTPNIVFKTSIIKFTGIIHKYPPKNSILFKIQIKTILAYSAKKKNTKILAECSVINPLTSSDSASAKSKGALLVSAIEPTKNIINIGNKGIINHIAL